jgi:hypothetical protein
MPTITSQVSRRNLIESLYASLKCGVLKEDVCVSDAEYLERCAKIIRNALQEPVQADCQHVRWFTCKCGRQVCAKCGCEYGEKATA